MNHRERKAAEERARAAEPVLTYYIVPRALVEAATSWGALMDAALRAGCVCHDVRKRDVETLAVPADHAVVYQGAPGIVFVAKQNW